jgi:site-specific DNA-methyltransferase (adenine-specific)
MTTPDTTEDARRVSRNLDAVVVRLSDSVSIIRGDCRDVLPVACDAVVTDPPYGCRYVGSPGTSHRTGIHSKGHGQRTRETVRGDDVDFDPAPFCAWPCVMSGAQHYYARIPHGGSLHSWDKRGDYKRTTFADADIIWCSRKMNAQTFRLVWRGLCRHAEQDEAIIHPTQKPVAVMEWMLDLIPVAKGATVLDPYMGSGTTGIACIRTGRKFIGIEIDAGHFATARTRLENELRQGLLPLTHNAGAQAPSEAR